MADALGADGKRFPDGLGTRGFAGVVGQAQTGACRFSVKGVKWRGAGAPLVAAQADADDGRVVRAQLGGLAEDALRFFHGEVANRVEDPVEREVQLAGGALAGAFQACEDGLKGARIEVAPHIDDADGNVDLGMDDALGVQTLHHAPCCQFVIFGVFQASRNSFEALNEFGEVREAIERFRFAKGQRLRIMVRAKLHQRCRQNRPLEMQMQLSLGKAADECLNRGHMISLRGGRRVISGNDGKSGVHQADLYAG